MTGAATGESRYIEFYMGELCTVLPLEWVERVVRIVEITPLAGAPDIVRGAVNVAGQIVPVVDLRPRFRLPRKRDSLYDRLILVNTGSRTMALLADRVGEILSPPLERVIPAESIVPGVEHLQGAIRLENGLLLIQDLERLLSLQEELALEQALREDPPA